jgi:hypothetical protein
MMQLEHNYLRTYTETFTRTVGATTRTGKRGTLPFPSPNPLDGNPANPGVIWLATNGSDANSGLTQALSKKTLNGAIAALTATRSTVHISRNSATGELRFPETVASTLSGFNIQSEEGEIGIIDYSGVADGAGRLTISAGTSVLNGVSFYDEARVNSALTVSSNSAVLTIENCTLENGGILHNASGVGTVYDYSPNLLFGTTTVPTTTPIIRYSMFIGQRAIKCDANCPLTLDNNINLYKVKRPTLSSATAGLILAGRTATYSNTIAITECLFSSYYDGQDDNTALADGEIVNTPPILLLGQAVGSVSSPGPTITITNSYFHNSNSIIWHNDYDGNFDYATITVDYSHLSGNVIIKSKQTIPSTITATITNQIEGDTPPLFHNEIDAIGGDIESFRLQRVGQTTPDGSGRFFLDSPLIAAGLSSVDVNPFDESVALNTEGFNDTINIDWPSISMTIENMYTNPSNLRDVNGNLHRDYDTERRKFIFDYTDQTHLSNLQLKELRYLLADRGSKRFYPLGIGGNLFYELGSSQGVFSSTDNSFAPNDAASTNMVVDWWRGFWINIAGEQFYIESNDETKMYLVDKLSLGFPTNGSHSFTVDSILINIEANTYAMKQTNFTQFSKGGFLREDTTDVRNYDYTISQITFEEVEDIEENI